ncbi:hypothetical protein BDP67DRAFT_227696 [Colletotrichum lupini]|nr:hypothetical protein BDP67DRAFT_227696 [Colletotrichum lupini]
MFHVPPSTRRWRFEMRWRVHVLIFPLSTLSMQIMCVQCNHSRHRLPGKLRNVAELRRYQHSTNHLGGERLTCRLMPAALKIAGPHEMSEQVPNKTVTVSTQVACPGSIDPSRRLKKREAAGNSARNGHCYCLLYDHSSKCRVLRTLRGPDERQKNEQGNIRVVLRNKEDAEVPGG